MSTPSVAITGATGFIGNALMRSLVDGGWRVKILVRRPTAAKPIPVEVSCIEGDLSDRAALGELLHDVDSLVHCAGLVRGADEKTFMRTNAEVMPSIASAARHANLTHFVLLSSLAASQPQLSAYARSKLAGETALLASEGDFERVIIRPPAVYGPGDREMLPLFKAMASGLAPTWTSAAARFSLIYIDDLVAAIRSCLEAPKPISGIYDLHDGTAQGYSMGEVIEIAERVLERRVRRVAVPGILLRSAASINLLAAKLFGYEPMLTPWKCAEISYPSWLCDNAALHAATGWSPQITLVEGLPLALRESS